MRITISHAFRRAAAGVLAALALGLLLRGVWLTADPPSSAPIGIVWHDEGAWLHNARNKALWGAWRTDNWNPVFVAPVFTGIEYAAFRLFGVGTWQARTVPVASGLLAIAALAAGLGAAAGRRAALIGAWLLSTNYVFVMWNRAALMESTMTAFIVLSWGAYAAAHRRPAWGYVAGVAATLAWFSKAAAAFFIAAIVADSVCTLVLARIGGIRRMLGIDPPGPVARRAAGATLVGLAVSALIIVAALVVPHWTEYRFYNWQMPVMRKPSYTAAALLNRASWLPIVQDFFTRMWLALVVASLAVVGIVARWRTAAPAERLLALWMAVGLVELIVHDAGNERRYVMFIPALVGLAALVLGSPAIVIRGTDSRWRWLLLPFAVFGAYVVIGSLLRVAFLGEVRAGEFSSVVRLSAVLAGAAGTLVIWRWRQTSEWLSRQSVTARSAVLVTLLVIAGDLAQYAQWTRHRTDLNYRASIEVGQILPQGTLVHGKLANGLSLENRIRPIFVGQGFGNYADRKGRDDVRYVLTYTDPYIGYEGRVIRNVLEAYPQRTIVRTFAVAETPSGHDRAALIDKFGNKEAHGNTATRQHGNTKKNTATRTHTETHGNTATRTHTEAHGNAATRTHTETHGNAATRTHTEAHGNTATRTHTETHGNTRNVGGRAHD